jgi:hypothetical protein
MRPMATARKPMHAHLVRNGPSATRILLRIRRYGQGGILSTSRQSPRSDRGSGIGAWVSWMLGLAALFACGGGALADQPAASSAGANELPNSMPQDGLFSSIKQSIKEGDRDVVRGHFDLGSPPNVHRYYCLVDPRSGTLEPNGVLGDPVSRDDGMTGIKSNAVSLYRCAKAEQQGILVTDGYVLSGRAALGVARAQRAQTPPAPAQGSVAPVSSAPAVGASIGPTAPAPSAPAPAQAPGPMPAKMDRVDVSGVSIGMSLDEARSVLKSKKLPQYKEWTETLSTVDGGKGTPQSLPNGRFVNTIAAWSAPAAAAGDSREAAGEAFQVMFTPEPGKERVMAVMHSVGYGLARAIHERALEDGLVKKYGGFSGAGDLPQSPTWRVQSGGEVAVGDTCNRRALFGGLGELDLADAARENLALKKPLEEFQYQVERCGASIVTEDHFTANAGALADDRLVTRYTVTAYSPVLAYDGARAAAQLIHASGHGPGNPGAKPPSEPAPDL